MRYLLKPVKFRSVPSPKSSRVHCNTPLLFTTRHGRVTCSPTMAIWSKGSLRNAWPTSVTLVAPWQNESMLDEAKRIGKMRLDFTVAAIFIIFLSHWYMLEWWWTHFLLWALSPERERNWYEKCGLDAHCLEKGYHKRKVKFWATFFDFFIVLPTNYLLVHICPMWMR